MLNRLRAYNRHLINPFSVWLAQKRHKPLPSFRFRNGLTWHHGEHDDPVMLLREIYLEPLYKPLNAPPNAVVFDLGANIGAVTLFWSQERSDTQFHCFEPNPQAAMSLTKNLLVNGLNDRVKVHHEAIGGKSGQIDIWSDVPTVLSTVYGEAPPAQGGKKVTVPMITLDAAWERAGKPPIWMLKIDVEGAEGDILDATSDELLAHVNTACVEWHDNIVPGVRIRCIKCLREAGFRISEHVHPWEEGILYADRVEARLRDS